MRNTALYYLFISLSLTITPVSLLIGSWQLGSSQQSSRKAIQAIWQEAPPSQLVDESDTVAPEKLLASQWLSYALETAARLDVEQQLPLVSDAQIRLKLTAEPQQLERWLSDTFSYWPYNVLHPFVLSSVALNQNDGDESATELTLHLVDTGPSIAPVRLIESASTKCALKTDGKLLGNWHDYTLVATLAAQGTFSAYFQATDDRWYAAEVGDYFQAPTTIITHITHESVTFKQLESFPCATTTFQNKVKRTSELAL
ncbi:hypothetical protein BFR57_11020 [Idiomarina sp. MD25a]|uniref:hypothetical protein n=1 Tax=Idiomarina sp. MD25a TaxID=1889913 RepID=UPI0008F7F1F2|nr:hypothetical protein [Idiomarina sp. MD25a]OIN03210.1 hypothetical protein BFR57_11020 [Idiomarina sp. MD25a]